MPRHHDLLLTWLSTVGRAGRAQARRAAEGVELDPTHLRWAVERGLGELRRAGHVEREKGHWRVVDTTLIWRRSCGELYGARDETLAETLLSEGLALTRAPAELGAEVWRISGDRLAAEGVCERLGIRRSADHSDQLLAALPSARAALLAVAPLCRRNPLIGRSWQRFRAPGTWGPEKRRLEPGMGLWRSRSPRPFFYLWKEDDDSLRDLNREEHRWLARWVSGGEGNNNLRVDDLGLTVPLYPRLPVLIDRSLRIAAGGDVHKRDQDYWYPGIDETRAAEVARILGASLQRVESSQL
jgi:hypothetical protein